MKQLLTLLALLTFSAAAYSQGFGTIPYIYVGHAGFNAALTPGKIYRTYTPHDASSFVEVATVSGVDGYGKVNAVGISCTEGYLYGMEFPLVPAVNFAAFYRIAASGVATKLGSINAPIAPGSAFSLINTTAGVLDQRETYWFTAYSYSGSPAVTPFSTDYLKVYLGRVDDVNLLPGGSAPLPVTYTELDFTSDPNVKAAFQNFLNNFNYTNYTASDGGAEDLALNPADGKFYTYMSYPDPSNPSQLLHRPMKIDLATAKITTVGTAVNSVPNREIAGLYFDIHGGLSTHMFVLFTNGQYGTVNLTTGALDYPLQSTPFPLLESNLRGDLASGVCVCALPVELMSFTGRNYEGYNVLEWKTAKEENVGKMELQRSKDGLNFTTITSLAPKGNNSEYRYQDSWAESAYYRLQFVDLDGTTELSPTIYLKRDGGMPSDQILVFPTEVTKPYFSVSGLPEKTTIKIYNLDGKLLDSRVMDATATQVPLTTQPGMYIISITDMDGHILSVNRLIRK